MTEHPMRRAEDLGPEQPAEGEAAGPTGKAPRRTRRSRDFFRKVKQPLIGLGVAAAAAPMIRAGEQPASPGTDPAEPASTPSTGEQQVAGADLEEKIATRIGEARAVSVRDTTITKAVDQYGIEQDLAEDIYDIAAEAGIEPHVAYGLVKTESAFKQRATSHVGARGLTQVMPRTGRWLKPGTTAEDLYDRKTNLSLGFKYLNQLIDKYDGDVDLALTAYNRGPGTVDRVLKRGGNPDNGYAGKVSKYGKEIDS